MTKELRDVLGAAEAATERNLPGFDHVVMARGARARAKRRRVTRAAGTGILATAALGLVGTGSFLAYDHFSQEGPAGPTPSVSSLPSPSGSPDAPDWPVVAERDLTVADGLPSAVPLTAEALGTSDAGWVLTIFDSTFRPGAEEPIAGERVLYLISPEGERFEVANLSQYGAPYLSAWDTDRDVAYIVENRYVAVTVDLASGEVTHEWQFCGEGGSLNATDLPGEQWLLRGFCSGEALDGIYDDAGTFITAEGIVKGGEGITVMNVDGVQVRYEFEMPPAESFRAYFPDGAEVAMQPVGEFTACYPMGPSGYGGLAAQCWADDGSVTIWDLRLDGSAPVQLTDEQTLLDIEAASGGSLVAEGAMITGWAGLGSADQAVVVTSHPAVVALGAGTAAIFEDDGVRASNVLDHEADLFLVTSRGSLWYPANSGNVILIPVGDVSGPGEWVGVSEGGAIIHP